MYSHVHVYVLVVVLTAYTRAHLLRIHACEFAYICVMGRHCAANGTYGRTGGVIERIIVLTLTLARGD